jgi:hypothetical protein
MHELDDLLFGIHEKQIGLSFSDCTIEWWKWIIQIPKSINPLFDTDGKNAYLD